MCYSDDGQVPDQRSCYRHLGLNVSRSAHNCGCVHIVDDDKVIIINIVIINTIIVIYIIDSI